MNYTRRKKIRHQVLNGLTFFLVAVNLIPVAWMTYSGFKDNNEILAGLVKPGRRANDLIHLETAAGGFLAGSSDGTLTLFDGKDLSVRRHARLGTYTTSYHREGDALWVLSSNKGLQEVDPATLEVRATHPISRLADLYGPAWKTLWVTEVWGSSLTGSGGMLYLAFNYNGSPGLTAFSPKDGAFRKVDAYSPKDMGMVRFLASMQEGERRTRTGTAASPGDGGGLAAGRDGGNPAPTDSIAIGTREGIFFLQVPSGQLGKSIWAGEKLPDSPDRFRSLGSDMALIALADRACLYDLAADSVKAWLPTEILGASRIASLASVSGRLWVGNSRIALALRMPSLSRAGTPLAMPSGESSGSGPSSFDSLQAAMAAAQVFHPGAPSLGGTPPPSPSGGTDMSGSKVSVILPLEDGKVLLGGPRGALSLLSADGRALAAGTAPPGAFNIQWRNYVDLWRSVSFGLYLKNSLIVCISVMLIAVLMASLGGYALARFKFPGKNTFGYSILATQMIPGIMLLLPVYLMFVNFTQATGIIIKGTYGGLILTYAAYFTPFSIWILRGFFASIPKELEEAALIDGCGPFKAFFRIIVPSAMPGIVATGVYVFLAAWDELMFAWVLTSESTYTIPVGIRLFVGNFQNRYDLMMAAATVSTIPVMILFFVLQKQIVSGLTAGAVKD